MVANGIDPRIVWALERMQQELHEPLSLATLAAGVNLSVSRFGHLFRKQTGLSPRQYLHSLRMHRARVLIENTFLSVKEVMVHSGFRDASHFSREFRRHHGVSPSAFRLQSTCRKRQEIAISDKSSAVYRAPAPLT